jgi:hypothetical protein
VSIKLDPLFIPLPEKMPPKQGCQIYIGTTYQNWGKYTKFAGKNAAEAGLPDSYWYNIPKLGKIYQICRKKPPKQGCQVYIGTTYQNWGKYTKFTGKSRRSRVARFILVQHTKTGENIPNLPEKAAEAGLPDLYWYNIPKRGKYTKLPHTISNVHQL